MQHANLIAEPVVERDTGRLLHCIRDQDFQVWLSLLHRRLVCENTVQKADVLAEITLVLKVSLESYNWDALALGKTVWQDFCDQCCPIFLRVRHLYRIQLATLRSPMLLNPILAARIYRDVLEERF